ncbi:hypothetical protein [Salisaeta longa]|uniref:hypothetical protein n=1 Tax=Salisaeta longa TaxID=503170 RepID=UPI0003B631ED|nr:hypothetical protein [Salisaeta longa]
MSDSAHPSLPESERPSFTPAEDAAARAATTHTLEHLPQVLQEALSGMQQETERAAGALHAARATIDGLQEALAAKERRIEALTSECNRLEAANKRLMEEADALEGTNEDLNMIIENLEEQLAQYPEVADDETLLHLQAPPHEVRRQLNAFIEAIDRYLEAPVPETLQAALSAVKDRAPQSS